MELLMIKRTGEIKSTFQCDKVELGKQVSLTCHI